MRAWLDALVALMLAPECAVCRQPLHSPTRGCVCAACWQAIVVTTTPACTGCGEPLETATGALRVCATCLSGQPAVTQARAIGPHTGALRGIVHALKYERRRSLAAPLGRLMHEAGAEVIAGCTAAVPVPLHRARRRARGFNQADDLARHLGLPVVRALRRVRPTRTQTTLPAGARHDNVAGAFTVTRRVAGLRGTVVLLVDDVRTTGATLDACAVALKQAGVREVRALTAARVATPRG